MIGFAVFTGAGNSHPAASMFLQLIAAERNVNIAAARPVAVRPIDPEAMSGLWEAPDGHGGAILLELKFVTLATTGAMSLDGVEQRLQHVEVSLHQRTQAGIESGDENSFEASARGGVATFEAGRLILRVPSFGLQLKQVRGGRWACHVRGAPILFRHPLVAGEKPGWAVGTWREQSQPGYTCLHVAEDQQGNYLGWSDAIMAWGKVTLAPGVKRPDGPQQYGEPMKVHTTAGKGVVFELYAYSCCCCSHRLVGIPTPDGRHMHAEWEDGGNMAAHSSVFERRPDDRCLVPNRR